MKVFHSIKEVCQLAKPSAVAIGNFDGVHLGHARLIGEMLTEAKARRLTPTVLTFFPHPVEVLSPGKKLERLTTTSEKLNLLEDFGVEQAAVIPFTTELAQVSREDFFTHYLQEGLKAKSIAVGFNFRFGKDRGGDTSFLEKKCAETGVDLKVVEPVVVSGIRVSSSHIRGLLLQGAVKESSAFLGRPYFLTGKVVVGDGRGEQLGFPTANLQIAREKLFPKKGVYVTEAVWQKQRFRSVTNIGIRPTFPGATESLIHVETHLLDFKMKLYDELIRLEFIDRLRDEKRFDSIDDLRHQIEKDIAASGLK